MFKCKAEIIAFLIFIQTQNMLSIITGRNVQIMNKDIPFLRNIF